MRRGVALSGMALAFVVGLVGSHGCVDDRAKVQQSVFLCNPASRTADADCGKGFMCYAGAQALGGSFCAPTCDPANADATCPGGACTQSGACLTRCKVPEPGKPDPCTPPLLCTRTTINPLEAASAPDGVCLPMNAVCAATAGCTSPVFNECTSAVDGAEDGPGLLTTGHVCVQGGCAARDTACNPGSACVKKLLPKTVSAPDVCSPICTPVRDRGDMGVFNECLPTLTCLSDAFPQTDSPACAPGFPGWLCVDDLGCTAGGCYEWSDVAPQFSGFKTCAPACKTDDDCMPFDRGGNPSFVSHNTCHEGRCRNFGSLFFPMMCTDTTSAHGCHLDPEATCVSTAADMGMVPQMGLGAFGGLAAICVHGCTAKSDCDPVAQLLHVPMTCGTIGPVSACVPMIPFLIQCKDDGDCFGDLTCQTIPSGATSVRTCTRGCTAASDCAGDGALGSSFACVNNLCVPKTDSGEQAALPEACLSGRAVNGKCVSPTGWACNDNTQCANGQCLIIRNTDPPFGRCN